MGQRKPPTPPMSACGHPNAGQELCYLCHQRSRRNIPVSFTEERKRREEEEDRLLQQFQYMKDAEDTLGEQVGHSSRSRTFKFLKLTSKRHQLLMCVVMDFYLGPLILPAWNYVWCLIRVSYYSASFHIIINKNMLLGLKWRAYSPFESKYLFQCLRL